MLLFSHLTANIQPFIKKKKRGKEAENEMPKIVFYLRNSNIIGIYIFAYNIYIYIYVDILLLSN